MGAIASQITSLRIVYSTVYSDADQRKHQSSASLAFVYGIHRNRWIPRIKGQLRGKCFHLMTSSWRFGDASSQSLVSQSWRTSICQLPWTTSWFLKGIVIWLSRVLTDPRNNRKWDTMGFLIIMKSMWYFIVNTFNEVKLDHHSDWHFNMIPSHALHDG